MALNKNILIISLIIFLFVCGVSYAWFTDSLTIGSTISTGSLDVCFGDGSKSADLGEIRLQAAGVSTSGAAVVLNLSEGGGSISGADGLTYELGIADNSTIPVKTSIINGDGIAEVEYIDSDSDADPRVKLDLSGYSGQAPGTYDLNVDVVFEQFNSNGEGYWKEVLPISGTIVVEAAPDEAIKLTVAEPATAGEAAATGEGAPAGTQESEAKADPEAAPAVPAAEEPGGGKGAEPEEGSGAEAAAEPAGAAEAAEREQAGDIPEAEASGTSAEQMQTGGIPAAAENATVVSAAGEQTKESEE